MTAEHALDRVRARLTCLPTGRLVNSNQWNAITLDMALDVVDQVAAEVRESASAPHPAGGEDHG